MAWSGGKDSSLALAEILRDDRYKAALTATRSREPGLNAVVFGDLFLADIRAYRERMLARLGMRDLPEGVDTASSTPSCTRGRFSRRGSRIVGERLWCGTTGSCIGTSWSSGKAPKGQECPAQMDGANRACHQPESKCAIDADPEVRSGFQGTGGILEPRSYCCCASTTCGKGLPSDCLVSVSSV